MGDCVNKPGLCQRRLPGRFFSPLWLLSGMLVIARAEGEGCPEGFFQRRFVEGFIEECDSSGLPPARFRLAISMRRDENDR